MENNPLMKQMADSIESMAVKTGKKARTRDGGGSSPSAGSDACKLEALKKIQEIVASGWAGVMPNGNIVDRRVEPTAIPIQKNTLLNVPEPKHPNGRGKPFSPAKQD